ncbi:TadE/TadG family type IV pilus assembly protein [Actinoplanes awajinensis]|nr:TadE/TadG family type IV pilus assembly protein [Actinoplanes awajinensis]
MPDRHSSRNRTRRTGWPECCAWFSLKGRGVPRVKRRARNDRGVAALETAIVMPVLLLIMFGIIDMGRMLQQFIQLTEAAREGARLGALNGSVTDVKTKISGIVGTSVTLTYTTATVCTAGSGIGTDSKIVVQRSYDPITPLIALVQVVGGQNMATITLSATGVMSCVG